MSNTWQPQGLAMSSQKVHLFTNGGYDQPTIPITEAPLQGRPGRPRSPLDFRNRAAISKNVRQRSVGQTVQKLLAIWSYLDMIHDGAPDLTFFLAIIVVKKPDVYEKYFTLVKTCCFTKKMVKKMPTFNFAPLAIKCLVAIVKNQKYLPNNLL